MLCLIIGLKIIKENKMVENTQHIIAFGMPGGWEWIIILIVALLIFGRKLPDVARSVGKSLNAFKKGLHEVEDEVNETKQEIDKEVDDVKRDIANDIKDAAGPDDSRKT